MPSLTMGSSLLEKDKGEVSQQTVAVLPFLSEDQSISPWFAQAASDLLRGHLFDLSQTLVLTQKETVEMLNRCEITTSEQITLKRLRQFQSISNADWLILGLASQSEKKFNLKVKAIFLENPEIVKKFQFKGKLNSLSLTLKEAIAQIAKACDVTLSKEDMENLLKPDDFDFASLESLYQGKTKREAGRIIEAEKIFLSLLEKHPDFIEPSIELSELYFSELKREKALGVLSVASKRNPHSLRLLTQLGYCYGAMGKDLEAKEFFERVLLVSPYQSQSLLKLSNIFFKQELYELAIDSAQKGIRFSSNKSSFYILLGDIYQKKGDFVFALEMYKRALKLDPNSSIALKQQGIVLALLGDYEKAESIYAKGVEVLSESKSKQLVKKATTEIQETYQENELQEYIDQVNKEPENVLAVNALGAAWEQTNDLKKGEESYKKAIQMNPNFQPAYFNLGVNLAQQNKQDEAIDAFNQSIRLNPKHLASYISLGDLYWNNNKQKKAIGAWERGFQQLPKSVEIVEKLVHGYAQMNKWKHVVKTYKRLASSKGGDEDSSLWIGRIYLQYGKDKQALKFFNKGLKENPDRSEPYKELAVYYDFYGNDPDKAIEYYQVYLDLESELENRESVQLRLSQLQENLVDQ